MRKTKTLEIIGVLSLSFILTSAMAVSGGIPAMIEEFSNYSRSSVELLLSVTSFSMMTMIILSPIIAKHLPERVIITIGLLIYAITGVLPVFIHSYPLLFVLRVIFGLGTGLVNAKAITMVGERFSGDLQQTLQGIRCSMETLGQTILTLIAGRLLKFGWNYAFLIYGVALIILILFLAFVPEKKQEVKTAAFETPKKIKLYESDYLLIIGNALLGYLMVSTNVSLALRIPSYLIEIGIGTAADGATIMGISTFAGFIAGILFGALTEKLGIYLLPCSLGIGVIGLLIIIKGGHPAFTAAGAAMVGFCVTCVTSKVFGSLPEQLHPDALATANACVLVGCNLGSFTAPFVLRLIDRINPSLETCFYAYLIVYTLLIIGFVLRQMIIRNQRIIRNI